MTRIIIYSEADSEHCRAVSEDAGRIAEMLDAIGIGFARWPVDDAPSSPRDDATIFAAYAGDIARLESVKPFRGRDILRVTLDSPDAGAMRTKFLDEHTHDDAEIRFFVEGAASFFFHANGNVIKLECEKGDLIDVPPGARHWFDVGARPNFTLLRLFRDQVGWQATPTGDPIARSFVDTSAAQIIIK
jgi:1,2-dihydroxy-3-keto-5-methylthiopentene dioxygenase